MFLSDEQKTISLHIKRDYYNHRDKYNKYFQHKYSFQTQRSLISPIPGKVTPEQGPTWSYSKVTITGSHIFTAGRGLLG